MGLAQVGKRILEWTRMPGSDTYATSIKAGSQSSPADRYYRELRGIFSEKMDDDLHLDEAVDVLQARLSGLELAELKAEEAAGLVKACEEIDDVLQVLF